MKYRSSCSRFIAVAVVMAASVFCVAGQGAVDIEVNKRPLQDFWEELKSDIQSKRVDLSGPFLVEMRGKLDDKGKLDATASTFTRTEGDTAVVEKVKRGILAISDSGFFEYLKALESREFGLVVEQSTSQFSGKITIEQPSDARARTLATTLKMLLGVVDSQRDRPNLSEDQKKELALITFMSARAESRTVIISFVAPAEEFQRLVAETLAK